MCEKTGMPIKVLSEWILNRKWQSYHLDDYWMNVGQINAIGGHSVLLLLNILQVIITA
jgi:hypothetical protein